MGKLNIEKLLVFEKYNIVSDDYFFTPKLCYNQQPQVNERARLEISICIMAKLI